MHKEEHLETPIFIFKTLRSDTLSISLYLSVRLWILFQTKQEHREREREGLGGRRERMKEKAIL